MIRFTFILILGLILPFSSGAMTKIGDAEDPCSKILNTGTSIDRRHLEPAIRALGYNNPSIISKGINKDGQVVLAKENSEYVSWYSDQASYYSQITHPGALTPQGDPRWFIYLAGIELAQNFSFEIKQQGGEILLLAPGAAKLKDIVSRVNKVLIRKGQDPIVYLPVHADFLNAAEILNLSVSAQEPFVTYAPYAENDETIVVHEIAWHLGAMLLPKKFHENSRAIDLEIVKLADRVRKSNLFGCEWVAQHLLEIRSLELDAGNADFVSSLAGLREKSAMAPYQSIASGKNVPWKFLQNSLRYLARPGLTPQEVAIMHLKNFLSFGAVSDLPLQKNFNIFPAQAPFNATIPKYLYQEWIESIVSEPSYAKAVKSTKDTAEIWAKEVFEYMDKRIDQLNLAFLEANAK